MYIVSFHPIFNENAIVLSKRMGIPFIVNLSPKQDDIIIIFGAHEQADKLFFLQKSLRVHYIIIQSEQFESKVFDNKYYMDLIENNALLDWSIFNVARLKNKLKLKIYSLYFYDFLAQDNLIDFEKRDIDFFFTGAHSVSREKMLNDFKLANPSAKFEIDFSYSYTNPASLNEKLKNVKYVINLPFYNNNALETHRIHRALSIGCEVISLPSADQDMNYKYSKYVHFVPRLNDFSILLENERKTNYNQLLKEFGNITIENNIRSIVYAESKIKEYIYANPEFKSQVPAILSMPSPSVTPTLQPTLTPNVSPTPLRQPVTTDFSKFIKQKKLNENNQQNLIIENGGNSSVQMLETVK
jgi:hypothetical protein